MNLHPFISDGNSSWPELRLFYLQLFSSPNGDSDACLIVRRNVRFVL